jgi:hypothetical protein
MTEGEDEAAARAVVEAHLGVVLTYIDVDGRVDYVVSRDEAQLGCLEVTRCTDQLLKAADLVFPDHDGYPAPGLRHCWMLSTNGHPQYNVMKPRLVGALAELEAHHLVAYDTHMRWWLRHVPTLAAALTVLDEAHVEVARCVPANDGESYLVFMPEFDGMSDGPDGAVAEIEAWLAAEERSRDREKLRQWTPDLARTDIERHLFVWVDEHSSYRVRRPLERDDRLPSVGANLPEPITNLWLVDEQTRHGWHYGPHGWTLVRPVE